MNACAECGDTIDTPQATGPYCAFCRTLRMPAPDRELPDEHTVRAEQRRQGCR